MATFRQSARTAGSALPFGARAAVVVGFALLVAVGVYGAFADWHHHPWLAAANPVAIVLFTGLLIYLRRRYGHLMYPSADDQ